MRRCLALFVLGSLFTLSRAAFGAEDAPAAAEAKCPYPVAHDAPLDAKERLADDKPSYTRYRVEFNGIKKDRVPAYLYVPKDGKAKHPAVLLQYGSGGHKGTFYIVALAEQFVSRGFVCLTIDVPMRGERKPPRDQRGWQTMFAERGRFQWYCGDYSRAVDYLQTRDDVDPRRIGYAGVSWGAITGITFTAHDERVKAMASIVGGGNFMGVIADKVEMPKETVEAAKSFDPVYHVHRIAPRPLLLMNVTKDQLVPRFFADALHKAAGDHAKKVWVETDHFFQGVDRYAVLEDVIAFMLENLSETKTP
ncbi:MAG TPA: alpha/beta fold hydrolase [Tepidisphaeraceae bacterium]|nr:alpha/beta fold hydrolase [Tepidisphaeraceae bacterium]